MLINRHDEGRRNEFSRRSASKRNKIVRLRSLNIIDHKLSAALAYIVAQVLNFLKDFPASKSAVKSFNEVDRCQGTQVAPDAVFVTQFKS